MSAIYTNKGWFMQISAIYGNERDLCKKMAIYVNENNMKRLVFANIYVW